MGLIETLKWLWDPSTEEDRQYRAWNQQTPLQRHTQHLKIYIKGADTAIDTALVFEDREFGSDWVMRRDLNEEVRDWLANRATRGVQVDNTWYAPDQIERIELTDQTVGAIV